MWTTHLFSDPTLQTIFHSQCVWQVAPQRPLWEDLHHAVLQLRHEKRSGMKSSFPFSFPSIHYIIYMMLGSGNHQRVQIILHSAYIYQYIPSTVHIFSISVFIVARYHILLLIFVCACMVLLFSSVVAPDQDRSQSVRRSRTGLPPRVGKHLSPVNITTREPAGQCNGHSLTCCLSLGPRELHPRADPHSASAGRTGEVLLLLLRLHGSAQVLLLPGPPAYRSEGIL